MKKKVWIIIIIIIWTTSIYKVYVKIYQIYSLVKMFREGKRSDQCLFKSVLIYLFRCVVCVCYRWKWYRECLVCLYLAGCLGLSIASDLQHLFCISSLPQAWPHMKTVPHVCYNPQQASCASLKKIRTVKQQDEGLFLQALDRWGWWISVDGGVKLQKKKTVVIPVGSASVRGQVWWESTVTL